MRILTLLALVASPTLADPMTGAEFDAFSRGKTFDFAVDGVVYGREEYLPNHRVRWAFLGEDCMDGYWYERVATEICFIYADEFDEQCWHYSLEPDGTISAEFLSDPENLSSYVGIQPHDGLFCPGPDVGV